MPDNNKQQLEIPYNSSSIIEKEELLEFQQYKLQENPIVIPGKPAYRFLDIVSLCGSSMRLRGGILTLGNREMGSYTFFHQQKYLYTPVNMEDLQSLYRSGVLLLRNKIDKEEDKYYLSLNPDYLLSTLVAALLSFSKEFTKLNVFIPNKFGNTQRIGLNNKYSTTSLRYEFVKRMISTGKDLWKAEDIYEIGLTWFGETVNRKYITLVTDYFLSRLKTDNLIEREKPFAKTFRLSDQVQQQINDLTKILKNPLYFLNIPVTQDPGLGFLYKENGQICQRGIEEMHPAYQKAYESLNKNREM